MKASVISVVSGHYGHITIIYCDDVEILGIKALQIFCIKQPLPSSLQTMQSMPAPQLLPSALNPYHQNTCYRWT